MLHECITAVQNTKAEANRERDTALIEGFFGPVYVNRAPFPSPEDT